MQQKFVRGQDFLFVFFSLARGCFLSCLIASSPILKTGKYMGLLLLETNKGRTGKAIRLSWKRCVATPVCVAKSTLRYIDLAWRLLTALFPLTEICSGAAASAPQSVCELNHSKSATFFH